MPKAIKANDAEINLFISISEPQSIARSAKAIPMSKKRAKKMQRKSLKIREILKKTLESKISNLVEAQAPPFTARK